MEHLMVVQCVHLYCLECLQYFIAKNVRYCLEANCKQEFQLEKLVNALTFLTQQFQQQQDKQLKQELYPKLKDTEYFGDKRCSYCHSYQEALYNNISCPHSICVSCLEKYKIEFCFVDDCGWEMDKDSIKQFLDIVNNFMYESKKSIKPHVKILNQQSAILVTKKRNINPDYLDDGDSNVVIQSQLFMELQKLDMSACNLKSFIYLYEDAKQFKQNFFDQEFPPLQESIGGRLEFAWARAPDIFNGVYQFFAKDTQQHNRFGLAKWLGPDDIKQGRLGNCYLLAAIAAVGNRRPDLLLQNFVTQTVNEKGIYGVRLNINGIWKVIYIDDYFPVCYNQPVFARPVNNAIWVMVIEKAWAKLHKSYNATIGGRIRETFKCLTGAPTEKVLTSDENFKQKLKNFIQMRLIIGASSKLKNNQTGLAANHAYSVLKFRTINHPTKNNVELIKLRNPWGSEEWNGDWSKKSPLWTEQLRKELKLDQDRGGVFYMAYDQFIQGFVSIDVCHVRKNYYHEGYEVQTRRKKAAYFKFDVQVPGEYYISLNQKNTRFPGNPLYSQTKFLLIKQENNSYSFITGKAGSSIEIWERLDLQVGSYIIYVKAEWLQQDEFTIGLQVYGSQKVILRRMEKREKQQSIISQAFTKLAEKQPKEKINQNQLIETCLKLEKQTGFGYYYIQNNSNQTVKIKVEFTKFTGLKLRKPFKGTLINLQLQRGQNEIFILKISPNGSQINVQCTIN